MLYQTVAFLIFLHLVITIDTPLEGNNLRIIRHYTSSHILPGIITLSLDHLFPKNFTKLNIEMVDIKKFFIKYATSSQLATFVGFSHSFVFADVSLESNDCTDK